VWIVASPKPKLFCGVALVKDEKGLTSARAYAGAVSLDQPRRIRFTPQ